MPSGVFFFATGNDLRQVLSDIDNEFPVEFIETVHYNSPEEITRYTVNTIPDLGISKYGEHVERPITVIGADEKIVIHTNNQEAGMRYSVNNGDNPNSVTL